MLLRIKYPELENILGSIDRSRAIYHLAMKQPMIDMPDVLHMSFIHFQIEQGEYEVRHIPHSLPCDSSDSSVYVS